MDVTEISRLQPFQLNDRSSTELVRYEFFNISNDLDRVNLTGKPYKPKQ